MPRTDERGGPKTRARILEVSNRLFLEHGYDKVTVAEVGRQAGVSSVTVFKHFPRKEDLFFDRADDADEIVRAAVRDRAPGADALAALHEASLRLFETRHPLSGVNGLSVPFFRTVAASPALLARARELAADLQRTLTEELDQDPTIGDDGPLLAAFFIAGYSTVMVETASRLIAGEATSAVVDDHRARLDRLFEVLRHGVAPPS